MPSVLSTARWSLAAHFGRLRQTLDGFGQRLREAIASAVGESVAGTVRETVRAALAELDETARPTVNSPWDRRSDAFREEPYARGWRENPEEELDPWAEEPEPSEPAPCVRPAEPQARRWARSVAAGCEAVAWRLRRQAGRSSLLVTLSVGLAAGAAAYLGGAVLAAGAGVVGSVLSLLALVARTRAGAEALSRSS